MGKDRNLGGIKMKAIAALLLIVVGLSGCTVLQQKANNFRSNSYVGYVPPYEDSKSYPIDKNSELQEIQNVNTINSNTNNPYAVKKDDCISITLVSGYLNQDFEPWLEKTINGSKVKNEITISIAAYESTDSTALVFEDTKKLPNNTEYNIITTTGQQKDREFAFADLPIYGPRKYNGGDIVFQTNMVELDEKEVTELKDEITGYTKKIKDSIIPEKDQGIGVSTVLKNAFERSTLTLSGAGIMAVGLDAVKLFANAYEKLNKDDDIIIQHTFSLSSENKSPELYQPLLRIGYYPLIRIAVDETKLSALKGLKYDPVASRLLKYNSLNKEISPVWLGFKVSSAKSCN